jgi:acetyl-CoA carboxylase carboxyltransferase component
MCGKAYDPRFVFAWPTARYSVMSGEAAASTLVEIKLKQLEREGKAVDEVARKELYDSIRASYTAQMKPEYGAARLWIDKIIDPAQTREALAWALAAARCNPVVEKFSVGILQT